MKRSDLYSSVFWFLFGAFITQSGYALNIGRASNPGSGFIIFWMGIAMMVLSANICLITMLGRRAADKANINWAEVRWKKIAGVLAALVVYGYILVPVGFLPSTCILLIYLFKGLERQKWSVAIFGAASTALIAYVVFDLWLGSQLPKGLLELVLD
jgi:putative tricarboxylic transport membrane protein